jgi:hypothetical protein
MNERVRARFQSAAAGLLEDGETVELAILTHTGPIFYDPLLSTINLINMLRGKTQGRVLLLTDRRVLYARTGLTGSPRELIASWPPGAAPIGLEARRRGGATITVDGERSSCRGPKDAVDELVAHATGAASG